MGPNVPWFYEPRWIAALAYSMYLFQMVAIDRPLSFLDSRHMATLGYPPMVAAGLVFATLFAAAVVYAACAFLFVERPFLSLRRWILGRMAGGT